MCGLGVRALWSLPTSTYSVIEAASTDAVIIGLIRRERTECRPVSCALVSDPRFNFVHVRVFTPCQNARHLCCTGVVICMQIGMIDGLTGSPLPSLCSSHVFKAE